MKEFRNLLKKNWDSKLVIPKMSVIFFELIIMLTITFYSYILKVIILDPVVTTKAIIHNSPLSCMIALFGLVIVVIIHRFFYKSIRKDEIVAKERLLRIYCFVLVFFLWLIMPFKIIFLLNFVLVYFMYKVHFETRLISMHEKDKKIVKNTLDSTDEELESLYEKIKKNNEIYKEFMEILIIEKKEKILTKENIPKELKQYEKYIPDEKFATLQAWAERIESNQAFLESIKKDSENKEN